MEKKKRNETEQNRKIGAKGVRIRTINLGMLLTASIIYILILYATIHLSLKYEELNIATENYVACVRQAGMVTEASEYLTMKARMYAVDRKIEHAQYYVTEINVTKRREAALEELEKYKDRLYYIDYAEVVRASEEEVDPDTLTEMAEIDVEADTLLHRHPEDMQEPMPIGVFLTDSPFIAQTGSYHTSLQPVFGIVSTTERAEIAKQYLNFLWDDTIDFTTMIDTELF